MKTLRGIVKGFEQQNEMRESAPGCGGSGHAHHHEPKSDARTIYQCPMKCEGDKTYDAPGRCPVCGMHLVPIED